MVVMKWTLFESIFKSYGQKGLTGKKNFILLSASVAKRWKKSEFHHEVTPPREAGALKRLSNCLISLPAKQ